MRLTLLLVAMGSAYAAGLTPTPPAVAWTYVAGSHVYPSQAISLVSSSGATAYSATANSENGWLLVNAAYASSSANLAAGAYLIPAFPIDRLDNGAYQGTVNFTDSNGNTAAVVVNLTVTGTVNPNPVILTNPASLAFTSALGGPPQTQNVAVTGPTGGVLQVQAGSGWVQTVVTGAAGTYTLVVTVTPGTLGPGTYRDTLTLSIGTTTATLPVLLTIQQQSLLSATPPILNFEYTLGGTAPPTGVIQVRSTGSILTFGASANVQVGNWLRVVGGGSTPNTVLVMPQVDGLDPGFYTGNVLITPQQGAPLIIPVTLTLRPAPVISASSNSLSFFYKAGDAAPAPLSVQIAAAGANPSFTIQTTAGADWLTVTAPARLVSPVLLTVSVKPASLAPGTYSATITITGTGSATGSASIAVSLQVGAGNVAGSPTIGKVANAAGYQEGSVAPGEMVTIFGTGMAPAGLVTLTLDAGGKVSTTLNGVQVLFDGIPSPVIYTSPTQMAVVAPYELDGRGQTNIQIISNGQASNSVALGVTGSAPGIFTADASGRGTAAATTAPPGGVITLYLTGEGQTLPRGETGKVTVLSTTPPLTPSPVLGVSVMIAGQPADFTFAGEAPGIVAGVLQLNVTVPGGLAPGSYPIVVSIGGRPSQAGVTIDVTQAK